MAEKSGKIGDWLADSLRSSVVSGFAASGRTWSGRLRRTTPQVVRVGVLSLKRQKAHRAYVSSGLPLVGWEENRGK
ncbi:Hypothetical protein NTJ_06439 [Nesidiocoris tenuis]|uniref:Uncharacterized protein n=1 Tax=Nesidiocoris tenuis TaxID=355587 RepID=A0ABN7ART5_9HEMI|nr:Hypothetical protein NTJ_06439 [Nesidiocoris tenuis]